MDRKDKELVAKPSANSYALWAKYTPEHERFKQKIIQAPLHIICTMRSKQDYILEQNERGKTTPKKVGLAPIQREGTEYEFTTVFDLNTEHVATVSKDRTGIFDQQFFKPDETTGKKILEWIASGKELIQEEAESFKIGEAEIQTMKSMLQAANLEKGDLSKYLKEVLNKAYKDLTHDDFNKICAHLNERIGRMK